MKMKTNEVLKIQRKNLLSMKMVVSIELESFEFGFSIYQENEMALWVHGLII